MLETCGIWLANQYVEESGIVACAEHKLIYLTMTLEAIEGLEYLVTRSVKIALD